MCQRLFARAAIIAALLIVLICGPSFAASLTLTGSGVIRPNGSAAYNLAPMLSFDAAVDASLPVNTNAVRVTLDSLISGEGLLGGPAPGAHFTGAAVALPSGMSLTAVSGQPALNSGLANSTAVFVDLQGDVAGTHNLYYLGAPGEGNSEANRVEFKPTDVGTNADDIRVLRPVSFDNQGKAIEVRPGERGVLEAGAFRFMLDPSMNVFGMKITFIDTEANAALNTGIFNIMVNGSSVPQVFHVPTGANDNEYFVGFLADEPITSFDVRLGWINGSRDGGDGVLLDMSHIELITVPEPGSICLLASGLLVIARQTRRRR